MLSDAAGTEPVGHQESVDIKQCGEGPQCIAFTKMQRVAQKAV